MILTIVLFIIWSGYAILEGWRDAHYFHFRIKVECFENDNNLSIYEE